MERRSGGQRGFGESGPTALHCHNPTLTAVFYVLLATTAYAKLGNSFDPSLPITSVLPPGTVTRLINLALLIRCLVACARRCCCRLLLALLPLVQPTTLSQQG